MTERGMEHMEHVRGVALADVAELQRKEATYKGSWKRRGGVGAFMMVARKWDRLEGIVQELGRFGGGDLNARPYDIFGWIEAECRGERQYHRFPQIGRDGTALAEVRDLRRYLLLVEAEMVARGVVPEPEPDTSDIPGREPPEPAAVPAEDSNRHAGTSRLRYDKERRTIVRERNTHSMDPELATALDADAEKLRQQGADPGPTFTQLKGEELARIHEGTGREPRPSGPVHPAAPQPQPEPAAEVPEHLRPVPLGEPGDQDGLTDLVLARSGRLPKRGVSIGEDAKDAEAKGQVWAIVDRTAVEDEEDLLHLPRLRREVNMVELREVPPYYRHMYRWDEGRQTNAIRPVYRRWTETGH